MILEIITPDKKLFSGNVEAVKLPGADGWFGILENHAPLIATLKKGNVTVTDSQNIHEFPIAGGVVEVLNNKVIVLAES
jgi:F-type H+-transporting ATPase subunit epsilon